MIVYLLHFHAPICSTHPAQHYTGFTESLSTRIFDHLHGRSGVSMIRAAYDRGIKFSVVRCWKGDRRLERHLKSLKNTPKFCPYCSNHPWQLYQPNSLIKVPELSGNRLKEQLLFSS